MKKNTFIFVIFLITGLSFSSLSASAETVIFSDDFTTDSTGLHQTGSLNNWSISSGNLDVLGAGLYQGLCKNSIGQCLDMDGTSSNSSIITLSLLNLTPGDYLFEFDYGNNSASGNTLSYAVGSLINGSVASNLANGIFTTESRSFTVSTLTSVNISFIGEGPVDSQGTVLDNITLIQTSSVPATVIEITAPAADSTILSDTIIETVVDTNAAVTKVQFYADGVLFATDTEAPFSATWGIANIISGEHEIKVIALNGSLVMGQDHLTVIVSANVDNPPTISDLQFNGSVLGNGATLIDSGTFTAKITDDIGIAQIQFDIDGNLISGGAYSNSVFSVPVNFDAYPNGTHTLNLRVTDTGPNTVTVSRAINLLIPPPLVPEIISPLNDYVSHTPDVGIVGQSTPGSIIELFIDAVPMETLITTASNGRFYASVELTEGAHQISAKASNSRGTSTRSVPISVTYTPPAPSIVITSPALGAEVTESSLLAASVIDPEGGVINVEFFIDGVSIGAINTMPYEVLWDITDVSDGEYQLLARATNEAGHSSEATQSVIVAKALPPPPPFVAPYVSENVTVTPELSYGTVPIEIKGRIVDLEGALAPNVALKLVLTINGFERTIPLVSDIDGMVAFSFEPQLSDQGRYGVSLVHPDETHTPEQAAFTIERLSLDKNRLKVNAARAFPQPFELTVTAGTGVSASGVQLVAFASEQPSGSLPTGISIDTTDPITLGSNESGVLTTTLNSTSSSPETGTFILTLISQTTGSTKRGNVRIDYQLSAPQPLLFPTPTYINLGVHQSESVSREIRLENKGFISATDVQSRLIGSNQGIVPSWVTLSGENASGDLEAGEARILRLTAAPGTNVVDGIFNFDIEVSSSNVSAGNIPVSVTVSQSGEGQVQFTAADIYTNTVNENGNLIVGLSSATIRLQNEVISTLRAQGTTDNQGRLTLGPLPAGRYTYRATAENHIESTGRILIQPGITIEERTFLDYSLVSIEWSVVETSINDVYDIVLSATYQTEVPAPVVLMEPLNILLPDLQIGETRTGVISVTNYGFVRADNIRLSLPPENSYYQIEIMGDLPDSLEAKQRVLLNYKITGLTIPSSSAETQELQVNLLSSTVTSTATNTITDAEANKFCGTASSLSYTYICAAGDQRTGSAGTSFNTSNSLDCSVTSGGAVGGGASGGSFWFVGGPSSSSPTQSCVPDGLCTGEEGDTGASPGGQP